MLKKSLLATSILLSLSFASQGTEGQYGYDPFANAYNFLRESGLEGDELIAQLALMLEPIPAEVLEKKLPESTAPSSSTEPKEYRDIDHLKIHEAYDGQDKFLDPTDSLGEMLLVQTNKLTVRESSAKNFDCFFFSIIGENKELLTRVLNGNAELAEKLLNVRESAGRDFTPVRRAFFDNILRNQELKIQMKEGEPTTVGELIREIIGQDQELRNTFISKGKAYKSDDMNLASYFDYLCTNHIYLDDIFAVVFSYLYNVPVYVLNPSTEIGFDSLIVQSQTTAYYSLIQKTEPIYIYHLGLFGGHYWKLRFPGQVEVSTSSSIVTSPPETVSAASVLTTSTPSSGTVSVQSPKALSISLLTQEIPLDSSKLNGRNLVLKLTKPINLAEAQRLAEETTEALKALEAKNAHIAKLKRIAKELGFTLQELKDHIGAALYADDEDVESFDDPENETISSWLLSKGYID